MSTLLMNYFDIGLTYPNDKGEIQCFHCAKMTENIFEYKSHLQIDHSQTVIKVHPCNYCPKYYADQINAAIHILDAHRFEKQCRFCPIRITNPIHLATGNTATTTQEATIGDKDTGNV